MNETRKELLRKEAKILIEEYTKIIENEKITKGLL